MHGGNWLTTVARRVIVDVRRGRAAGELGERLAVLDELGAHAPTLLADLLIAVASYVPDEVIAHVLLADREICTPVAELIYREAHNRRAQGSTDTWVLWGERGYQHLTYRLQRERRGA